MTQMNPGAYRAKPSSNVYTVLTFVAFLSLLTAVGVLWWKNTQITGDTNPFTIVSPR